MKSLIYMNYSIYSLLYLSRRFLFLFLAFRTREGGLAGIIPTIAISPMNSLVKATWELFAIVRISEKSLPKQVMAGESDTWQDEQDAKRQAIEEAANAKRREAAEAQHKVSTPRRGETMVVVPKEQAPKPTEQREEDRAPGRSERAKAANVSPSTQGYLPRGKLDEACKRFGIAYDTAAQAKRVCSQIESCRRLQQLGFYHHQEVANRDDAQELLEWAVENKASVKELRDEKKRR